MYKKFFIGILGIEIIISIFFVFFAYLLSSKNIWNEHHPAKILNEHRIIAESITRPKVLIIGGSSSFFGINTEKMTKLLNYPVINLGVNAGLGLDYIFFDAKKSIQDNDIVILPLEYGLYYEDNFSKIRITQIWQNDKQYFNNISIGDKIQLLYSIPFDLEKTVIEQYIGKQIKNDISLEYMIINRNGDSVNTFKTKEKKIIIKEPFYRNKIYLDKKNKQTIIDFLNYCKEKNVKVFVTYPPYYYKQKYFDGYNLEQINKINQFWKEQDVIILGQYTDFIYTDKSDFYDTEYHLNIKGREKRTEKLIEFLKPYINNN